MSRSGFVVLSTDEAPLLEHSLACAVREGFDDGLVIDNASTDGTTAVASMLGVEVLRLDRRVPYTEAMNRGLRALDADVVAMLQAYTFVGAGYLPACSAALSDLGVGSVQHAEDPMPGGVGARRDDGDLGADHLVDQGRLAHIGPADHGDEA